MSVSHRTERVAALIKSELARILITEVENHYLRDVVITHVDVTKDLKNAFIYFSAPHKTSIQKILDKANHFFRKKISENIKLRVTPCLHFKYDTSLNSTLNAIKILDRISIGDDT